MYKYETHCHTKEASKCARWTSDECVRHYKKLGYDGIFVTDHFFNGSNCVPKDIPWEERVAQYVSGYENAKKTGDEIGIDVFFGVEFNFGQTEFLIYGIDRDFLLAHPDCDKMEMREFIELCHEHGYFCVHAHPFRQRKYIKCLRLYPEVTDAVEVINSAHPGSAEEGWIFDDRATAYARSFGFPVTGASDCHYDAEPWMGGIYTEEKITCWQDYAELVKAFKVTPFRTPNPFVPKVEE